MAGTAGFLTKDVWTCALVCFDCFRVSWIHVTLLKHQMLPSAVIWKTSLFIKKNWRRDVLGGDNMDQEYKGFHELGWVEKWLTRAKAHHLNHLVLPTVLPPATQPWISTYPKPNMCLICWFIISIPRVLSRQTSNYVKCCSQEKKRYHFPFCFYQGLQRAIFSCKCTAHVLLLCKTTVSPVSHDVCLIFALSVIAVTWKASVWRESVKFNSTLPFLRKKDDCDLHHLPAICLAQWAHSTKWIHVLQLL